MSTDQTALNRATFPGVPDSIADLWAKSPVAGGFDPDSLADVQAVLNGSSAIVNAMAGGERFRVTLSGATSTAATDLKRRDVAITTAALRDTRLSVLERLAVTSGMAQHEAGHGRISAPMMEAVHAAFPGNVRAHRLSNIVEDVRLEQRSDARWPAYRGTFALTLWWVANRHPVNGIDALPLSRAEAVNFCVAAARYSAHTVWANDPAVLAERDWWADWSIRAAKHDEPAGHVEAIREALEHIEHLPDQAPQGDEPGTEPGTEPGGEGGEGEGEPGGEPGAGPACTCGCSTVDLAAPVKPGCTDAACQCHAGAGKGSEGEGEPTDEDGEGDEQGDEPSDEPGADNEGDGAGNGGDEPQPERDGLKEPLPLEIDEDLTDAERLNDALIAQGLRSTADQRGRDEIVVTHPLIGDPDTDRSRERTAKVWPAQNVPGLAKGTDPSVQAALRQAFTSRKTSHENKSIASTGSRLSANRLYRARTGSSAVFVRKEGISPDRLDVHFVVDASSSMGIPTRSVEAGVRIITGTRMSKAQDLTANLVEALLRLPAIRQHVWSFRDQGHTAMLGDVLDTRLSQGVERIRTINAGGGTPTATAVRAIGEKVIAERKPRERSIVVVITDGQPSEPAEWVRAAVNSLNDQHVAVLAVAISDGLTDSLRQCYGADNVVIWHGDWRRLGRELGQALGRLASI